jgi:hypothetical protein
VSMLQMLASMMGGSDTTDLNKSLGDAAIEWREFRADIRRGIDLLEQINAKLNPAGHVGTPEPVAADAADGETAP